jgi:hypothetical protein
VPLLTNPDSRWRIAVQALVALGAHDMALVR